MTRVVAPTASGVLSASAWWFPSGAATWWRASCSRGTSSAASAWPRSSDG